MQDGEDHGRGGAHAEDPPVAARVKALEAILLEKGLVDRAALEIGRASCRERVSRCV